MTKKQRILGKLLFRKKSAVLVEFRDQDGNPFRYSFPADDIKVESDGSTVYLSEEMVDMGIPYGVPWEHLLKDIHITADQLASNLRKNNIWTAEDAMKNPNGLKGALLSSLSVAMSSVIRISKEFMSNKEM